MKTNKLRSEPASLQANPNKKTDLIYRRIVRRLMPILFLAYVVSYIDRSNIGFAKLQMQHELALSDSVYGFGAGVFFIGYFLFEIPSNLLLHRLGAKRWISRIMFAWGTLSTLMYLTRGPLSFYLLRFMLGAAEAGLVPGVILYLTYWFPSSRRARILAIFYAAVAVSGIIGGPASGWLMHTMNGALGLGGWQWVFIVEGIPSILMGFIVLRFLDSSPKEARWLSTEEKDLVISGLDQEFKLNAAPSRVLRDPLIWLLTAVFFMQCAGITGVGLWMPSLVQATGIRNITHIGFLTAIPYVIAICAMFFHCRHSDHTGERCWHTAIPMFTAAIGLVLAVKYGHDTVISLIGLTLTASGILCSTPPFWSITVGRLSGRGAAVGVALVAAVGNLGSFASPFFVGIIREMTHGTSAGFYLVSAGLLVGGLLIIAARKALTATPSEATDRKLFAADVRLSQSKPGN